ncbi:hypothetical protein F4780DRAFT_723193 [Xylariomycetidae sp. FL0641]|nr:hypothetical protein F4780DRAFT_723193 [Xylariomycetidae sp. FL0641]
MVRQQRTLEHEFEKREPALHRRALDRPAPPETDWAARRTKAPMVAHHLSRGIDKMREAQLLLGGGRSGPSPSDDLSEDDHHRQHEPGYQKIPGAAATTFPPLPRQDEPGADKKGRSTLGGGGRNLFTKIMRSGRPEAPR